MPTLRIFLSSPGDVEDERRIAQRVIERLRGEFVGRIGLDDYLWEYQPMVVRETFQAQIPHTQEFDLVLCFLWSRLGTPLTGPDGRTYASGTEYEVASSLESFASIGKPELMLFINRSGVFMPTLPKEERDRRLAQLEQVEDFFNRYCADKETGIVRGAFTTFSDLGQFERVLEEHLRRFVLGKLAELPEAERGAQITAPPSWTSGSPFRGLRAFEFEHAPIFFGRTRAIGEVLARLRERAARVEEERLRLVPGETLQGSSFLAIAAPSGLGKSSLVRAGVLPLLVEPGYGIACWRRATLKPSDSLGDLFDGLAAALLSAEGLPELADEGEASRAAIADLLRRNPSAIEGVLTGALRLAAEAFRQSEREKLIEAKQQFLTKGRQPEADRVQLAMDELARAPRRAGLVMIVDQLEELFTLDGIALEARDGFIAAIAALARTRGVAVLATVRADFYMRCAENVTLRALLDREGTYVLAPPSAVELGQIIRLPAQAAGLHFERSTKTDQPLDEALRDAAMKSPESLPLLEFCLEELYRESIRDLAPGARPREFTFAQYEALGGLEGAIGRRAEEVFAAIPAWAQEALPAVMRQMVTLGQGDDEVPNRRPASWGQLVGEKGALAFADRPLALPAPGVGFSPEAPERLRVKTPETAVSKSVVLARAASDANPPATAGAREFLDAFVSARLMVAGVDTFQGATVTLVHEALLTHWPRLAEWVRVDRDFLRLRAKLEAALRAWEEGGRDAAYLLAPGRPLAEAQDLLARHRADLGPDARAFIELSGKAARARLRQRLILTTTAAVLGFALAGVATWQWSLASAARNEAEAQKAKAIAARQEAEGIIEFLVLDLRDQLAPLGRLDIVEKVQQKVDDYYQRMGAETNTPDQLRRRSVGYDNAGDLLRDKGDLVGAKAAYMAGLRISVKLAEADRTDSNSLLDLSVSYEKLGSIAETQGDFASAKKYLEASLELRRTIVKTNGEKPTIQRNLAVACNKLAYLNRLKGDIPAALKLYEEALAITAKLHEQDPGNMQWQRDLGAIQNDIGDAYQLSGDLVKARAANQAAYDLGAQLAAANPQNTAVLSDFEIACSKLGDIIIAQGGGTDIKRANEIYQQALGIIQKLAAQDPSNASWQRGLAAVYQRVGRGCLFANDTPGALAANQAAVDISRKLVAGAPENVEWLRLLGGSIDGLATARSFSGDKTGATAAYEEGLTVSQNVAKLTPDDPRAQRDLSVGLNSVGTAKLANGDAAGALKNYEASLTIMKSLVAENGSSNARQTDLAFTLNKVGLAREQLHDFVGAAQAWRDLVAVRELMITRDPDDLSRYFTAFLDRTRIAEAVRKSPGANDDAVREEYRLAAEVLAPLEKAGKLNAQQLSALAEAREKAGIKAPGPGGK